MCHNRVKQNYKGVIEDVYILKRVIDTTSKQTLQKVHQIIKMCNNLILYYKAPS